MRPSGFPNAGVLTQTLKPLKKFFQGKERPRWLKPQKFQGDDGRTEGRPLQQSEESASNSFPQRPFVMWFRTISLVSAAKSDL